MMRAALLCAIAALAVVAAGAVLGWAWPVSMLGGCL
jgi:hypothetical protein